MTVRAIRGLWRWRRNPLRRTSDLVEAWVALVALFVMLAASPVIAVVVASATEDALQQSVRDQRAARHLVTATVERKLPRSPLDTDPETSASRDLRSRVVADWTAPDGTARRGVALADLKSPHAGDHFTIWTDTHGRIVARPLDSATAATHAALAGFGAAMLTAAAVEGCRRLIVWRIVRRRYARWDQAWDRAGPDWGRTGTGC